MREASSHFGLILGGLALFAFTTPTHGTTVSLKAVEVNGVPLAERTNNVIVSPGDLIVAEIFLLRWADKLYPLRIYQVRVLGKKGSTSGTTGTILPLGWPDTPEDGVFIESDLACTRGPNEGDTCTNSVEDCGAAGLCDCRNFDFIMCGFGTMICAVANDTLNYRYGCLGFNDDGVIIEPAPENYAGTLILEVSPDACGTFTFAMDSDPENNFLTSAAPEVRIHPDTEGLVIEVECKPCISSDPPNCAIDARYPHEPDDNSARLGWNAVDFTFTPVPKGGVESIRCGDFSFRFVGGNAFDLECTSVTPVDADTVHMKLTTIIPHWRWTCIRYNPGQPGCNETCLIPYPADVNSDRIISSTDVLDLIDSFNGEPLEMWQCDIDRDGQCLLSDLTAEIDLLTGVGAFRTWFYFKPTQPQACPTAP